MSTARPRKAQHNTHYDSHHIPAEETDLDSTLSFPHAPMHVHIDSGKAEDKMNEPPMNLDGDRGNIAMLIFLYVLQGIPLGLAGSIPYLLQSREVSYKDQAIFSFVYWPFSVKLLWAPIVDAAYFSKFGRRKSWLVPTQYLIGIFMFVLSTQVTTLLGDIGEGHTPDNTTTTAAPVSVTTLTIVFFMLNFLAATQDIAVDGWALTMLSRRNVGWASTCNTVGQTAGFFLGNVVFLALESADFCNNYLRSEAKTSGMVTLSGFLYFWGVVFLITTTLVMLFKKETNHSSESTSISENEEVEQGIVDTYKLLWRIIRLPAITTLIGILLTAKVGFAAADAVTGLKLIEEGVPRERLALLGVPMVPIQIILPFIISRYTSGPKPMDVYLKAMPYRLFMGLVFAAVVSWAPGTRTPEGSYPFSFYMVVLSVYAVHQVTLYCMFVSIMAFHAKISDPAIGGSYMTLLNTVANLGGNWPSTVALWGVDILTWKRCVGGPGTCDSDEAKQLCSESGGQCETTLDGYYVESVACVVIGLMWIKWRAKSLRQLQELPARAWTSS